ncbi:hypothetical protein QR680_006744 [Steinernema hermaphroditum]|uniref:Uncharacterized protein n=1 Tax=Steinernema hermaphroditum TaxID=289476 RepID=A0AA39HYK8_9BILA|nr:hypothetical protein QR680_006744 [Steinernema hermaphroditum]
MTTEVPPKYCERIMFWDRMPAFLVTAGIAGVLTVVFAFIVIQIRFCVRPALLRKIKKVQLEIMAEAKMSKKQQEETVTVTVDGPTN